MAGTAASVPEQAVAVRRGSRGTGPGRAVHAAVLDVPGQHDRERRLGSVQADLHAGVADLQWVVSAYALTFASTMLAFGMIADEFGRKRVMLAGAAVFCAGSVLSALAPTAPVLIAGRAVMGLGAAASEPGTLSMLRHLYPAGRERARAVGSGPAWPGWRSRWARSLGASWSVPGTGVGSSGSTWLSAWPPWPRRRSCCRKVPTSRRTAWTWRARCWVRGRWPLSFSRSSWGRTPGSARPRSSRCSA